MSRQPPSDTSLPAATPSGGGGMSLYASLLNKGGSGGSGGDDDSKNDNNKTPAASATSTTSAPPPVAGAASGAFPFQPIIRRPMPAQQKKATVAGVASKPGAMITFTKSNVVPQPPTVTAALEVADDPTNIRDNNAKTSASPPPQQQPSQRRTLAEWAAAQHDDFPDRDGTGYCEDGDEDEEEARQARRRKKKKQKHDHDRDHDDGCAPGPINWNDVYDPRRPTNIDEYERGPERRRELHDWLVFLRTGRDDGVVGAEGADDDYDSWNDDDNYGVGSYRRSRDYDDYDNRGRGRGHGRGNGWGRGDKDNDRFGSGLELDRRSNYTEERDSDEDDRRPVQRNFAFAPPASYSGPAVSIPDDQTGDDAYARRLALTKGLPVAPAQGSLLGSPAAAAAVATSPHPEP